jgi:predicted TIM-barrel fold metal-dependent hydrolase
MTDAGGTLKPISADSHVTEPPSCYADYLDPEYRDRAPRIAKNADRGDVYVIDGLPGEVPITLAAAAGRTPEDLWKSSRTFDDLHRGGWDPKARLKDQDKDGIAAEIIYPTLGMVLCNHPDNQYMHAMFQAYNRWLKDFTSEGEGRLFGIGQSAVTSVEQAVKDCELIREQGFRGVMLPAFPGTVEDYDHPSFDRLWAALADMNMPISFHTFTGKRKAADDVMFSTRGPKINGFMAITRDNQDLLGMFCFTGIFERFPKLRVVSVEADAGWVPHYIYRMDHVYKQHRFWQKGITLERLPSEYFLENVYLTFQDDWIAFKYRDDMNVRRLLWANDFPHSDATWPHSQEILAKHTQSLSADEKRRVLRDNVAELYDISLAA